MGYFQIDVDIGVQLIGQTVDDSVEGLELLAGELDVIEGFAHFARARRYLRTGRALQCCKMEYGVHHRSHIVVVDLSFVFEIFKLFRFGFSIHSSQDFSRRLATERAGSRNCFWWEKTLSLSRFVIRMRTYVPEFPYLGFGFSFPFFSFLVSILRSLDFSICCRLLRTVIRTVFPVHYVAGIEFHATKSQKPKTKKKAEETQM